MAKRKKIDEKKLVKMVEEGIHQNEIMKKVGIKTANQLWVAYGKAMSEAGKIPKIVGGRGSGKTETVVNKVKVGKLGSVIIPKQRFSRRFKRHIHIRFCVRGPHLNLSSKSAPFSHERD